MGLLQYSENGIKNFRDSKWKKKHFAIRAFLNGFQIKMNLKPFGYSSTEKHQVKKKKT